MGGPFSSDGSEAGYTGDGLPPSSRYDTLEEFIKKTDRDDEYEVGISVRLYEWQETLMRIVEIEEDKNKTEIGSRAYPMGLRTLSENHEDDINEIADMMSEFMKAFTSDITNMDLAGKFDKKISDRKVDEPRPMDHDLAQPSRLMVDRDKVAWAKEDYARKAFMEGWIHRHILSLGLSKSKHKREVHDTIISSHEAAFVEAVDEFRECIEGDIKEYVLLGRDGWMKDGIPDGVLDSLEAISEMMETDNKETVQREVEMIKQHMEGE